MLTIYIIYLLLFKYEFEWIALSLFEIIFSYFYLYINHNEFRLFILNSFDKWYRV